MDRKSGILMPVFSLPSKYGIGDFGKSSYEFVDYIASCGQKVWQILPLVQTGHGNSPYSSVSSKSFSPYFISPELLKEEGLLTSEEVSFSLYNSDNIDYGFLYAVRFPMLKKAFSRFDKGDKQFKAFVKSKKAYDYALFMALKYASGQKHFYEWDDAYKRRDKKALDKFAKDYKDEVLFWVFTQFIAQKQWLNLKNYANSKGISIMGDMPLYVALDSVDVWTQPHYFKLDNDFLPLKKAGVPPDYFCKEGQLWGNPVYDYQVHSEDGFSFWVNRLKDALSIYDYVRIDHFRALDKYYEIDKDSETAMVGEWIDVPSDELFNAIHSAVDKNRIIAEDLGIIDDGVRELLRKTGYPGMKILSFAFNGDPNNLYLPQSLDENCICYTGTHDNDTLVGLLKGATGWDYNNFYQGVKNSLEVMDVVGNVDSVEGLVDCTIELGMKSKAKWFILPIWDLLKKDGGYRINEPGTVKQENWAIRFDKKDFNAKTKKYLLNLTKKYNR